MTKVYDYQNNVMKTGVLYGISHFNRLEDWLTTYNCTSDSQLEKGSYDFCDNSRNKREKPEIAFKLYSDNWGKYNEIDTETEYYIQQFRWNEDKKEYEFFYYTLNNQNQKYSPSEKYYVKRQTIQQQSNRLFVYLMGAPLSPNERKDYKSKLSNTDDPSYVKITFDDTSIQGNGEQQLLDLENSNEAEYFIFDPVSQYFISEIGRFGKDKGVVEFYRDDPELQKDSNGNEKVVYRLRAHSIQHEELPIGDGDQKQWNIYVDGRNLLNFNEAHTPSGLVEFLEKNPKKGNNFVVTDEPEIVIFRQEPHSQNSTPEPSTNPTFYQKALILYKVGNTLLAKTEGTVQPKDPVSGNPNDKWNIEVDGNTKYSFTGTSDIIQVVNRINTSLEFKGKKIQCVAQ